jgi:hypothetical protein
MRALANSCQEQKWDALEGDSSQVCSGSDDGLCSNGLALSLPWRDFLVVPTRFRPKRQR